MIKGSLDRKLINDIEAGKHDELLSGMTNDDHMETMDAIGTICKSLQAHNNNAAVIPCKSMDTRFLKEELTRIPIWVKLHDVPIQVFEEDCISLIDTFIGKPVMLDSYTSSMCNKSWGRSSFARCLIEVNSEADLVDVVTIGGESPIVTTSNVVTPTVEKTNDGFHTVGKKKKRKGKSKSTNGGHFTTGYSSKKDNLPMSNSFSALNDEEEDDKEDVQNVYDESANLLQNTKAGGSLSFTATVG
uniref:Uncharacterized protein n=1 Tax=Tanacetum cinerariifolium TaxID=118510 RepID=A0A6L2MNF2_TANCI|nr:hypothetical protein [Tanacetum cinerariifolium]